MSELKRCPFCSGEAEITINKTRQGQTSVVRCTKCTCRKTLLKYPFYEGDIYVDAVKDWNTLKPMQNIVERLEETKTKSYVTGITSNPYEFGACHAMNDAIKIVKEEGEINDNT